LSGLADVIVDLVSTGNTLRANHLKAVEDIAPVSARLIVNQAALKLKRDALQPVIQAIGNAVNAHV
jgi:ATP phosphoribosyltransferase